MRINRGRKAVNEYGYRGNKKPKHTHTFPKRRVRVTLYSDEAFTDQYLRIDGRFHVFKDRGRVKSSTIYQMNILTKSDEVQQQIDDSRKGKKS